MYARKATDRGIPTALSLTLLVAAVLSAPSSLQAQAGEEMIRAWSVGFSMPASSGIWEDRFRTSYSHGLLLGADWRRGGLAGPVGLRVGGRIALGSTLVMEDTAPPCDGSGPSSPPRHCRSRGEPHLGVIQVTAGPTVRLGLLRLEVGGGLSVDLGGTGRQACIGIAAACIAMTRYPWPGVSPATTFGAGATWVVAGRDIAVDVAEVVQFQAGHSIRQRGVTLGVTGGLRRSP